MPNQGGEPTRRPSAAVPAWVLGSAFLLVVLMVTIGFPLTEVSWGVVSGVPRAKEQTEPVRVDWSLLLRSLAIAAVIGVLATACAWPTAWATRGASSRWLAVLIVPMLMPSYLAYIGLSQLRAPGTVLGDLIMRGPTSGPNWWPVAAAQVCAVTGLVLWSWPLAALILSARVRTIEDEVLDTLRLEPAGALRRGLTLAALCRANLVGACVAVALLMLGSAVPLHIAQLDTYAIELWRRLDETPAESHWRVWLAGWPLAVIAAAAAGWVGHRMAGSSDGSNLGGPLRARRRPGMRIAVGALWISSVVAPGLLMAIDLRHSSFLAEFWRRHAEGFTASVAIAAAVAALASLTALATWMSHSRWRAAPAAGTTALAAGLLVWTGLIPGVLLGSATGAAWNRWMPASDGAGLASVVAAHVARLGFVGALVGWWAARSETSQDRALRALDGAEGLGGWLRAAWPRQRGLVLAGGLAVGLFSFHEIESAVMLWPPGLDCFPRQMLQLLHYNRVEDLAAGVVVVMIYGLCAATGVVALAWVPDRRRPPDKAGRV